MADEYSVKDVLCQAMDYLSKLGSNLRCRSETLKDKRKDKLNNAIAVQKAADKVLLICELSKKSLANVEAGVRKILEQIDLSQASTSVGGKSTTKTIKKCDKPKYHYIDYKSRKLKIKTKISLKHYKSVKVLARKMTLSMIDKYPVYHDCNLYRQRKKEHLKSNKTQLEDDDTDCIALNNKNSSNSIQNTRRNSKAVYKRIYTDSEDSDKEQKKETNDNNKRTSDIRQETENSDREQDPKRRKTNQDNDHNVGSDDKNLKQISNKDETDEDKSDTEKIIVNDSVKKPMIKCVSLNKLLKPDMVKMYHVPKDDKIIKKKREFDTNKKNIMLLTTKKHNDEFWAAKRKEVSEFKSKEFSVHITRLPKLSTEFLNTNNIKKIVKQGETICEIAENQTKPSPEHEISKKKNTKKTIETSKDNEAEESNKVKNSLPNEPDLEKIDTISDLNKEGSDSDSQIIQSTIKKVLIDSDSNHNDDSAEKKKHTQSNRYNNQTNETISDTRKVSKSEAVKNNLQSKSFLDVSQNDKIEQTEKDSEPSSENVNVTADKSSIEDELKNNSDNVESIKEPLLQTPEKQKYAKKCLLNDSSNDETETPLSKRKQDRPQSKKKLIHENMQAKHALLCNSSGSDTEEQLRNTLDSKKETLLEGASDDLNKVKQNNMLGISKDSSGSSDENHLLDSESISKNEKSCNDDQLKNNSDNVDSATELLLRTPDKQKYAKKCLLNDSSNDETETPLSQRKIATPQSQKSQIRENIQAKHALLRHSSGSDTEDEQLRNTLEDIKKSLLEDMSDDENKVKPNIIQGSSKDSSSSSEDIPVNVKKNKSSSSISSKQKTKRKKNLHNDGSSDSEEENKKNSSSHDKKSSSTSSKMVRSKSKPGSSLSSEAKDSLDKDIERLSNLKTLYSSRRPNSDDSDDATESASRRPNDATDDETESSNATAKTKVSVKPTAIIGDEILKAESSSDAGSNDEDAGDDDHEDLPSVTISGFNGGLQNLAKDDLLGDSDSSGSIKEEKQDESDEGQLGSKRRKANTIASSDSEAGPTRKNKKDHGVKLSDFEDSDDSEITKRTKRKKKGSDSDVSGDSSDSTKQKKRRRIKTIDDSDGSGSDSENEGKNKHGRKNIRKVMGKSQLEEATKKAAREEKERVARIAERQKMYNNLQFDESGKPDEVVLDRVVLDFDPETKEPLIAVDRGLVKKLKPHQANGIKFMWDACFESVKRIKKAKGSGCILAHCMGLGKTLQVVALTHTLLAHGSLTKVERVLVVCPLSTVLNWVNEFKMWLKHAEREKDIDVYELSRFKQNNERAFQLSEWYKHGGVCVLGYEMFRNLSADNNKKFKKKLLKNFQEALVDPGPDLVVCDEGHLLKNEKTSLSQSMNKVRTLRRIVLTGTPLQNNLKEYYCMVQFVKPNLLGKYNEYLNRFVNPITNGQYTDSTDHDIKIMKRRSHVLHKMLDGAVQRRDYGVLAPFLPPKHEYVLFITLTDVQIKLYQHYLDNYSRRPLPGKSSGFLFPDFQSLQRIWTHPLVLKYNSDRYEILQQKKRDKEEEEDSEGSLVDFIDDDSTPAESSSDDSSGEFSDMSDDSRKKSKKKKSSKKSKGKDKEAGGSRRRGTRANPIDLDLEEDKDSDILEVKNENPTEWWIKMVEEEELEDLRNSHKLVLLFDILRQCEAIGDKLLVFSQSLYSLDLIEHFLGKVDEATQEGRIDEKLGNHVGSWSQGVDYFRLDGSTSCENRSIWCKNFNREDNPRARLFLISTRAGGLGINLVAANRVVIFDVSWNPSHDVQSIFRVYRFGQKKPCYVYRFLAMGTMEEKIYERQVTKQAISKRVIDEQQIDRHYAENDLAELYKFEAEPPSPRPLPPLPKDRLFAEMLREHDKQIYKYHEHDSLLENKEEETLSEEERKAAWEDFENEKNRPPPAPFPSPWQMNGMMPNMLAQQQQQLAYAALAAVLRKDMPNVNDNQIRDMLPMIYNANPALMQKMSEMLKYSQHMNMGPGMMGQPGMNSASSALGMGSTSGLQYEPPWQRQQQQQQQLRLQQLMAQQQNMGAAAKFYAGGLGSRDPVAMALQQQRAREIMVGGAAARPRGRPPMQPRAPPSHADVVNLDSD